MAAAVICPCSECNDRETAMILDGKPDTDFFARAARKRARIRALGQAQHMLVL